MSRPKLLKIRLIYSVEGTQIPLEQDIDPAKATALFFDEHAAVEILGGFYEGRGKTISKDQAIARFGIRAEGWFPKGKDEVALDKKFLKQAWGSNAEKPRRGTNLQMDPRANPESLPMMIIKDPSCWPSGQP